MSAFLGAPVFRNTTTTRKGENGNMTTKPIRGCSPNVPQRRLDAPEVAWREQWTAWAQQNAAWREQWTAWTLRDAAAWREHSEWVDAATKKLAAVRSLCAGEEEATPDAPPGYMDGWNDLARTVRRIIDGEEAA